MILGLHSGPGIFRSSTELSAASLEDLPVSSCALYLLAECPIHVLRNRESENKTTKNSGWCLDLTAVCLAFQVDVWICQLDVGSCQCGGCLALSVGCVEWSLGVTK